MGKAGDPAVERGPWPPLRRGMADLQGLSEQNGPIGLALPLSATIGLVPMRPVVVEQPWVDLGSVEKENGGTQSVGATLGLGKRLLSVAEALVTGIDGKQVEVEAFFVLAERKGGHEPVQMPAPDAVADEEGRRGPGRDRGRREVHAVLEVTGVGVMQEGDPGVEVFRGPRPPGQRRASLQ